MTMLSFSQMLAFIFGIVLTIPVYELLRRWLTPILTRVSRKKHADYQKLLKDASRSMSKIENLAHLFSLVVHFLTFRVGIRQVAIFTRRKDAEGFWLANQRGYEKNFLEYQMDDNHPLVQWLHEKKQILDVQLVADQKLTPSKQLDMRASKIRTMIETMKDFDAVCAIPSFFGSELKNILFLGRKKSEQRYTRDDWELFYNLAQEAAVAIENANLFDETKQKKNELKIINDQLEYSKSKLIKALQETERANKQLQDAQAQLIHEQKMATLGRLAASVGHEVNNPLTILSMNVSRAILKFRKDPTLKVADIMDVFQKMEQNISRIKAVVNTLTGLLKKSEKGKFEPLSLKLVLEETLPLVQFQTYLENLTGTEVAFEIPQSIPLVRGDLERLQEVFLNLFINAYHAMVGKRNRQITVKAERASDEEGFVAVHFSDNGMGMTEEIQKKIFNYAYTTKPPGKGSGMGLYMCKYIIELHGGTIRVNSTLGVGTTFILTLPIHAEPVAKHLLQKQD
ncbi:MAG: hypothetical protein EXS63_03470 [Candidatus Omnitrophica bacterium]|nr:hypothetical protein [Candidatus Omnitrophota bacterium]